MKLFVDGIFHFRPIVPHSHSRCLHGIYLAHNVDEIAIMVDGKEEKSHRLRLLHVMLLQIDVSG